MIRAQKSPEMWDQQPKPNIIKLIFLNKIITIAKVELFNSSGLNTNAIKQIIAKIHPQILNIEDQSINYNLSNSHIPPIT